ncbi:hypothetical protein C8Q77DRAFT_1156844 [Trametes polyzona]|nr:hypothetical protein C8Q77DRAFT_1156844 [Trametes polyzona]
MDPTLIACVPATSSTRPSSASILIRTSDKVKFNVNCAMVENLWPVFVEMFAVSPLSDEGIAVVDVSESSIVWGTILKYATLRMDEPHISFPAIIALLDVAKKSGMAPIITWMRRTLSKARYRPTDTMRTFALACAYGFLEVAQLAARAYLALPADSGDVEEHSLISLTPCRGSCYTASDLVVARIDTAR